MPVASIPHRAIRIASILCTVIAVGCGGGQGSGASKAETATFQVEAEVPAPGAGGTADATSSDGAADDRAPSEAADVDDEDAGSQVGGTVAWPREDFRTSPAPVGSTRERALTATVSNVDSGFISGCDRATGSDFIDGGTWNNRRLLPRHCEILRYNPPRFSWRVPNDLDVSAGWSFVLKTSSGAAVVSRQLTQASYRHSAALPAGDYEWQVSYRSKRLKVGTVVSDVRRFRVPAEAEVFLPPDGQAIATAAAAKEKPRILPAGLSFPAIRDLVSSGEYADAYRVLLYKAERALADPLPAEPAIPPAKKTSSWKKWREATQQTARFEQQDIEMLGFAWRLSGDERFREAGLARLVNIAAWAPDGATSDANHDTANSILALVLGRGFDLYRSALTLDQRALIVGSVRARLEQVLPKFEGLDRNPYDSHVVAQVRRAADALLWTAGEAGFPESRAWLASSWDLLLNFVDAWGDTDGGFGNGVAYAWYAQNDLAEILVSIKAVTGFNLARHPWVRNFPDYLMAHTTPLTQHFSSAGDAVENEGHYAAYSQDGTRLYAQVIGSPQFGWYWRQGAGTANPNAYLSPHHFVAFAMAGASPAPQAPTQHSWFFRDAGMVAIHDQPDATATRSTVHFRSSRFGSYGHSFADQNAFALISRGKSLLIPGGYYPWYLSNHHALVGRATRYKNALTFDGGIGQAEPLPAPVAPGKPMQSMDTRGEVVHFESRGSWTVATGDATLAYRGWEKLAKVWIPLLTSAVRTVAYNRVERVLLVYDYASSAKARTFELNFNALAPFNATDNTARVDHEGAAACIRVYGTNGGFATSSGFAVAPEFARPQQYQARFTASSAGTLAALTVIREDCRNVAISVQKSGTSFSVSVAGGLPVTLDRSGALLP
ncbi:MAG: DUF4962 domain-containing protein [Burkholderiales bacterium]|nr:DUF4962 domain-containing protein [Burkholderiales bacterium]